MMAIQHCNRSILSWKTLVLLAFWTNIQTAFTLKCVQCDSKKIGMDCWNGTLPQSSICASPKSIFCSIAVSRDKSGNIIGVIRTCETMDMGNQKCFFPDDSNQPYEICFNTCNSDGCNSEFKSSANSRYSANPVFVYLVAVATALFTLPIRHLL